MDFQLSHNHWLELRPACVPKSPNATGLEAGGGGGALEAEMKSMALPRSDNCYFEVKSTRARRRLTLACNRPVSFPSSFAWSPAPTGEESWTSAADR